MNKAAGAVSQGILRESGSSKTTLWARQDLNLGPMDYESTALTAELRARRMKPFYTAALGNPRSKPPRV